MTSLSHLPRFPRAVLISAAFAAWCPIAAAQSATFASLNPQTGLPVQRFDIDWPHSAVNFAVGFMGLSTVRGSFANFGGTLMYDPKSIEHSSISVVIQTKSINTNVEFRDKDLRSENFFDAEKYPYITFHSEKIEKSKNGFIAHGPLSMHGVTKPIAIQFVQIHPVTSDAWGNKRVGFVGHLSLDRIDYGILGTKFWNSEYDPGRMSISHSVDIDLTVSAKLSQVEKWTLPKGDSVLNSLATKDIKTVLSDFRAAAADTTSALGKISDGVLQTVTVKLMHRGRYADATEAYKLAIDLHPDASWAYAGLGEAYLLTGMKPQAADSFRKAYAIDSTNTVAYEYLRYVH